MAVEDASLYREPFSKPGSAPIGYALSNYAVTLQDSNARIPPGLMGRTSVHGIPPGMKGFWQREVTVPTTRDAAYTFMRSCGLDPTPDAVSQLTEVFLPCLRIMCERGYEPSGDTWREGGWRSQLVDVRKKFKRLWYHGWLKGKFVPDHGYDLINYTGFYQRLHMSGSPWGEWGEPEGDRNGY